MADQKITDLTEATSVDGTEYVELVQSATNKKVPTSLLITTREFNRTFSETLLFDKNEIYYASHTMTADLDFVVSPSGNLVDETSVIRARIVADGVSAINFISAVGASFDFIYPTGIFSGVILDAGTYEIYFLYENGSVVVNLPGVSSETSSLTQLQAPGNFSVVADGENALDLSWTDVADEVEYQIERSLTGTGGWTVYSNPAAGSTTDTETGLLPGDTVFYRIKAIGDGVTFADSPYSSASGTTEDSGDVTAPTFTFLPANGNSTWTVNRPITITANEELRNSADNSEIDSADLAATIIILKETNSGGANIPFSATIDVTKKIITITPTSGYGENQLVYLSIDNVEDVTGNEISLQSITFTTTEYTFLNGTSNRLAFGDILDSLFAATDTNFWLEITTNEPLISGSRGLISKYASVNGERGFFLYYTGADMYFTYWMSTGASGKFRVIKWTGAVTTGEHIWVLKYDGSIDTNDGLDRVILLKDGGTVGSKTLDSTQGALEQSIANTPSQLGVGALVNSAGASATFYTEQLKDFIVRSAGGTVVEINVPVIFDGTDTSGNNRNGTWA